MKGRGIRKETQRKRKGESRGKRGRKTDIEARNGIEIRNHVYRKKDRTNLMTKRKENKTGEIYGKPKNS